ncbi:hypothetical protein E8E11_007468 [Didymella keratinophila]|nr:hypothetical protein E8E11_007468 [Didymella keratinophila]
MVQHSVEAPTTQGLLQLNDGSASWSAGHKEIFDVNIRITNTKEKRRQIRVFKPSTHAQHDLAASLKQSPPSPYPISSPTISDGASSSIESDQVVSGLDLTAIGVNFVLT